MKDRKWKMRSLTFISTLIAAGIDFAYAFSPANEHYDLPPGCGCHTNLVPGDAPTFSVSSTELLPNTAYRIRLTRPAMPLSDRTAWRVFVTTPGGSSIGTLFAADGTTPIAASNNAQARSEGTKISVTSDVSVLGSGFAGGFIEYVWRSPLAPAQLPARITVHTLLMYANNAGGNDGDRLASRDFSILNPNAPPPALPGDPETDENSPRGANSTGTGFSGDFLGGCGVVKFSDSNSSATAIIAMILWVGILFATRRKFR